MEPSDNEGVASAMRNRLVDEHDSPFDNVMHEEVRVRVEEELRQISEPYRTTVILRDLEEMSYEEIAEITGFSIPKLKTDLHRARAEMRQRVGQYMRA